MQLLYFKNLSPTTGLDGRYPGSVPGKELAQRNEKGPIRGLVCFNNRLLFAWIRSGIAGPL